MSMPLNPMGQAAMSAAPQAPALFGHQQQQPKFSGVADFFVKREGGEDGYGASVTPRYGRIAATVAAVLSTALSPFALFDSIGADERCAITDKISGDVREVGPGLAFRPWGFASKPVCFPNQSIRVTETVYGRSAEGIETTLPVSVAWQIVPGAVDTLRTEVYGSGGTNDPLFQFPADGNTPADTEGSKAQIPNGNLDAVYEWALFSEARSINEDLQALIPASQLHTPAAKSVIHNAFMEGYNPREIYEMFEEFQLQLVGEEGDNTRLAQLLIDGEQQGLEDRLTERYGERVIAILDADARNTDIRNQAFKDALESLGQQPILQRDAIQEKETNRLEGEARQEDARQNREVNLIDADSEAQALAIVGEALRAFPETIQNKYADGFIIAAETPGQLIITDGAGENPIIIDKTADAGG